MASIRLWLPVHLLGYIMLDAVSIDDNFVHHEKTLGVSINDHAQIATLYQEWYPLPPRDRPPIIYFWSRGGRQITNRGAEVFHQLHDEVRHQGIFSYLEDGVEQYRTEHSQFIEDYEEIFSLLNFHDAVLTTAIPHAMDESCCLLPPYTGAPHLANRTKVIKWQIGYSFPSIAYFVDENQAMICDTHFLKDIFGCVKEAVIRAPPLPLYYNAAAEALAAVGGDPRADGAGIVAGALGPLKERLILYDNDHVFDASRLQIDGSFQLQMLDGLTREEMFDAYRLCYPVNRVHFRVGVVRRKRFRAKSASHVAETFSDVALLSRDLKCVT